MSPARLEHQQHPQADSHNDGHLENNHGGHHEVLPVSYHNEPSVWDEYGEERGYGSKQRCKVVKSEYKISADCTHRIVHQIKS